MCSNWTRLVHRHKGLFLPPSTCTSASCNGWEGLHQPCTKLQDFSLPRVCYQAKDPSVCTGATAQNNLAHPLCAAWSHHRHLGWVPQSIPVTNVAPQRWQLWPLQKAWPRKITERGFILWSLAVNLHFPKMFKSHWKHKGNTAENCWLLSDCSLKNPPRIKEGKYSSLKAYGSHQPSDELWGSSNFIFHRSPGRKWLLCKKKKNKLQIPIQSVPEGLYGLSALDVFNCCSEARVGSC